MNIFAVDLNPQKAAMHLHNKHIIKMILESAQMLCTTQRLFGNSNFNLYNIAFVNHPCTIWVRTTQQNYNWLFLHFIYLLEEYKYRYNKIHSCERLIKYLVYAPIEMYSYGLTPFAKAMPDKYKVYDSVQSYRNYYINEKIQNNFWKKRRYELDNWLLEHLKLEQFN